MITFVKDNKPENVLYHLKRDEIVLLDNISEGGFKNLCRDLGILNQRYGEFYQVVDTGQDYKTTNIPISQTREDTGVHTDSSAKNYNPQYVSLFCASQGETGGESYFVDMRALFFDLKNENIALLNYLTGDFYRDVVTPGTENNLENIKLNKFPIIKFKEDKLVEFRYMRYWIERAYKKLELEEELDSKNLDELDSYLISEKYKSRIQLKNNQAVIFNNSFYPHGRTSYQENQFLKRRFIRVWFDALF